MKKADPKLGHSPQPSRSQTKKLIEFGIGNKYAEDAAELLGIGMSDFVRLAINTCIAEIPGRLGANLAAARATTLFQTKMSSSTKRKFCTLDFGSARVQAKLDQIMMSVAEWSTPPEGKNTIQISSHGFDSGHILHFFEEDAFDEKWYRIMGCEALTDQKLRSAVGLLLFVRLYYIALGYDRIKLDGSLREEAKLEIQRVLRRHTKRTFYSLKKRYQRIPQLRADAEKCGKLPPFIRTKYWNDPHVLEFYVRWKNYPNNFTKEFTESDILYDNDILMDLSEEEK